MNIISVQLPLPLQTKSMELQLDLVLNSETGGDLSDFITNGEWYLLGEYFTLFPAVILMSFDVYVCVCPHKIFVISII